LGISNPAGGPEGKRISFSTFFFLLLPRQELTYGDVTELRDAAGGPGKSSLFFLTTVFPLLHRRGFGMALESDQPEIRSDSWQSALISEASGAPPSVRENRRERMILPPGRTHNRSRSPRLTASGR